MVKQIQPYLADISKNLKLGNATEHTHRPALKTLIEFLETGITATNEPQHIIDCGAPDFVITKGQSVIGYIETKDIGKSLDQAEKSDQLKRYLHSLSNLILTDYLEFRWYVDGEWRSTARLGKPGADGKIKKDQIGIDAVSQLLSEFMAHRAQSAGTPKELALRMARITHMIRDLIIAAFETEPEGGTLHGQFIAFKNYLIPDLTHEQFADMYAQTIAYGLFAARCTTNTGNGFSRLDAAQNLPKTNPLLRKMFQYIAGYDLDERIAWLVDDLAEVLAHADMGAVLQDFGKRTAKEDPVVHFYETFLAAYDPKIRAKRGVYYTPEPVVSYIVRSLDHILKTRFNRSLGLADTNTIILDPATGTATFLYFVIQHVYQTLTAGGQAGTWNDYVKSHLLPRIFGFELLMAPYAMAHMKLSLQLQETGYDFSADQRLGIYLTNSLEEAITQAETLGFAGFITEEANAAAEIKKTKPIMVVLGNPPYSVSSVNKGNHIEDLMLRYKTAVRSERNIQPLSDDYIKFIRFAHDRIERTGYGVVGMITNHSYLSGLIHRGMREELLKTFSEIYILNLHGNLLMGEKTPDGGKDENVFDIRQGVAIAVFIKKPDGDTGSASVKYCDLWGLREGKYEYLAENDVSTTEWCDLEPVEPHFFFVPKDLELKSEYEDGWSISEIFPVNSTGIKTHRDDFVLDFEERSLKARIVEFRDKNISDSELREEYKLRDTRDWTLTKARASLRAQDDWDNKFARCLYRPFDIRSIYYSKYIIEFPRPEVMQHMLAGENLGLIAMRQVAVGDDYSHFGTTRFVVDNRSFYSNKGIQCLFPLYLYPAQGGLALGRTANLSQSFITNISAKLGLQFVDDGKGDLETTFGPEDIFHYAYAVFHSPTYRERYAEFLKIDFPRLPLTSDKALFKSLAEKGEELVSLHLMESPKLDNLITQYTVSGSNQVENPTYSESDQRVYINKTQYFEGVLPEVWNFQVGGYQVCHKWLKDRKGRVLTYDDITHYQKVVIALNETIRLMAEIDESIPDWPIQ